MKATELLEKQHREVEKLFKKISKSDQGAAGKSAKPMTADHYYNTYGADMVRLSVGIEDVDDILWDIDQALERATR